jgi:hypothetical protein
MSRSGYSDECEQGALNLFRANVDRTIAGKRGQAFLREMAVALDAMPVKELVAGDIVRDDGHVCAIGSVALARKLDVSKLDVYDGDEVGKTFGITRILACEIAYENDEHRQYDHEAHRFTEETPEGRWKRMRAWVAGNLIPPPSTTENGT